MAGTLTWSSVGWTVMVARSLAAGGFRVSLLAALTGTVACHDVDDEVPSWPGAGGSGGRSLAELALVAGR